MDDDYAEQVLSVVERIPPGQVATYGDIAEIVGRGGPRQVGQVMALLGGGVPWWRVVRADGAASMSVLESSSEAEARGHIEALPFYVAGAMTVDIFEVRVL